MPIPGALFAGLIDDASMFPPGDASAAAGVSAHADYRRSAFAPLVGPLVVRLADIVDVAAAQRGLPASDALVTSLVTRDRSAGLVPKAASVLPGIRVVTVETVLTAMDDLAGEAAQVASAATDIDPAITVFVELPDAPGWEGAVQVIEAAGVCGKLRTGGPEPGDVPSCLSLAGRLKVLIDAELPFKATAGLHHALLTPGEDSDHPRQHGFLNLLLAVDALMSGASPVDAAPLLSSGTPEVLARLHDWDPARVNRIRSRFRSFGCCGVLDPIRDLVDLGLIEGPG